MRYSTAAATLHVTLVERPLQRGHRSVVFSGRFGFGFRGTSVDMAALNHDFEALPPCGVGLLNLFAAGERRWKF
ncbi:hypothetical protein M3J09_012156 [Ascochyta lentis]